MDESRLCLSIPQLSRVKNPLSRALVNYYYTNSFNTLTNAGKLLVLV